MSYIKLTNIVLTAVFVVNGFMFALPVMAQAVSQKDFSTSEAKEISTLEQRITRVQKNSTEESMKTKLGTSTKAVMRLVESYKKNNNDKALIKQVSKLNDSELGQFVAEIKALTVVNMEVGNSIEKNQTAKASASNVGLCWWTTRSWPFNITEGGRTYNVFSASFAMQSCHTTIYNNIYSPYGNNFAVNPTHRFSVSGWDINSSVKYCSGNGTKYYSCYVRYVLHRKVFFGLIDQYFPTGYFVSRSAYNPTVLSSDYKISW